MCFVLCALCWRAVACNIHYVYNGSGWRFLGHNRNGIILLGWSSKLNLPISLPSFQIVKGDGLARRQ